MNPVSFTVTFPSTVVEWAAANNINLATYIESALSKPIESAILSSPPARIQAALAPLRTLIAPAITAV